MRSGIRKRLKKAVAERLRLLARRLDPPPLAPKPPPEQLRSLELNLYNDPAAALGAIVGLTGERGEA